MKGSRQRRAGHSVRRGGVFKELERSGALRSRSDQQFLSNFPTQFAPYLRFDGGVHAREGTLFHE